MSKSADEEDIIKFSNGLRKTYRPINNNNKLWREMTAIRREWQAGRARKKFKNTGNLFKSALFMKEDDYHLF